MSDRVRDDDEDENDRPLARIVRRRNSPQFRRAMLLCGFFAVLVSMWLFWPAGEKGKSNQTYRETPTIGRFTNYTPPPADPPVVPVVAPPGLPDWWKNRQSQTQAQADTPPTVTPPSGSSSKPSRPSMIAFDVPPVPEALKPKPPPSAEDIANSQTHVAFQASAIPGVKAGLLKDTSRWLMPGLIRCHMNTAINSDTEGPFICELQGPVISDGNITLMDRGTQIIGRYNSQVKQGQKRLPALSATAWTPGPQNRCIVPLGGPMGDQLGRAGLPGSVDNHTLEKFGAAIALSAFDSAMGILQASVSQGGNTYLSFSNGGVSSLASEILRSKINILPTIETHQGDDAAIWILEPIDFSACHDIVSLSSR